MLDELKGGIVFVRDEQRLLGLTVLAFATTFLAVPLLTFLPLFARNVFNEGVGQYSQMMAFSGVGAVAGALVVAWLGKFRHMGLTALLVQLIFGALDRGVRAHARALGHAPPAAGHRAPR